MVDVYGKCRQIYHTWILWILNLSKYFRNHSNCQTVLLSIGMFDSHEMKVACLPLKRSLTSPLPGGTRKFQFTNRLSGIDLAKSDWTFQLVQ